MLVARVGHEQQCMPARCVPACTYREFHDWLDAPLLPSELRAAERAAVRVADLARGVIPA